MAWEMIKEGGRGYSVQGSEIFKESGGIAFDEVRLKTK